MHRHVFFYRRTNINTWVTNKKHHTLKLYNNDHNFSNRIDNSATSEKVSIS